MIIFYTAKNVHAINVFLGSDVRHESQFPSDVDREEWEEEQKVIQNQVFRKAFEKLGISAILQSGHYERWMHKIILNII